MRRKLTDVEKEYRRRVNREFFERTQMTEEERKAVKAWIKRGHCIEDPAYSPYLPPFIEPPWNYLDVYRLEKEIDQDTAGMSLAEKGRYLRWYWDYGQQDSWSPEQPQSMEEAEEVIRELSREICCVMYYVHQRNLWKDYSAYMVDHREETQEYAGQQWKFEEV